MKPGQSASELHWFESVDEHVPIKQEFMKPGQSLSESHFLPVAITSNSFKSELHEPSCAYRLEDVSIIHPAR